MIPGKRKGALEDTPLETQFLKFNPRIMTICYKSKKKA